MNTEDAWTLIGNIALNDLVTWLMILGVIGGAAYKFFTKIFNWFDEIREHQTEYSELIEAVKQQNNRFDKIEAALALMRESFKEQKEFNFKQVRNTIVHQCDLALEKGAITPEKKKSLNELYEEYVHVFNGNSYVSSQIARVNQLPILSNYKEEGIE